MLKFIHAADLHIDSPLRGLEQYEGAPVGALRSATRRAFARLVDLALDEPVDFVLLAGDLYDGDWRDYNTGLFFVHQMNRLREAGIRVFVVFGNHDAESQMTRNVRLPDNVRAFGSARPESVPLDALGVAIHGQSFARREITVDLSAAYPAPIKGLLNIGLLHTCAEGREGHDPYAPTSVAALAARGYDYWALGHVHRREVLHKDPWIVFPGNIQGRHIREAGPKGCTLVTIRDAQIASVEHRDLDVLRWERCAVEATGARTPAELLERTQRALAAQAARSGGRLTAIRLELAGPCGAHADLARDPERWQSEIRALGSGLGEEVWLEKIQLKTSSERALDELLEREEALGGLLGSLRSLEDDAAALERLAAELFTELQVKLPAELRQGDEGLDLKNPALLRAALGDVRQLLITHLAGGEA